MQVHRACLRGAEVHRRALPARLPGLEGISRSLHIRALDSWLGLC